jgi:hypothetical protein
MYVNFSLIAELAEVFSPQQLKYNAQRLGAGPIPFLLNPFTCSASANR